MKRYFVIKDVLGEQDYEWKVQDGKDETWMGSFPTRALARQWCAYLNNRGRKAAGKE